MTIVSQLATWMLAELGPLQKPVEDAGIGQQASQVTLVWLAAIVLLLGMMAIAFKKSKRTHLD